MANERLAEELQKILEAQEETRKKYAEIAGPPIELPEMPEAIKQEIMKLFGEPDPLPSTPEEAMNEYFSRPRDPEEVRRSREIGRYWHNLYQEKLDKGHFRT